MLTTQDTMPRRTAFHVFVTESKWAGAIVIQGHMRNLLSWQLSSLTAVIKVEEITYILQGPVLSISLPWELKYVCPWNVCYHILTCFITGPGIE